ncbi:MAG TPA: site-2 protease family protein [Candidatus Alectryocaccomicrobium excrementavium]|uniref:Site-2 protease family protein n=1 Tax=Candidatus Alectryocaccomicrobium excrementavium TaxID=2840668 RepID=A0A9D1FZR8_9FIRM|nr:site-2 protease family protein [Candidatus Alectryocaccomicrobium excrementavium]
MNLSLAIFNLIPLPPLDGYHVLNDLVLKRPLFASPRAAMAGQGILILLMVTDILPWFLGWALSGVLSGVGHAAYAIVTALGVL